MTQKEGKENSIASEERGVGQESQRPTQEMAGVLASELLTPKL